MHSKLTTSLGSSSAHPSQYFCLGHHHTVILLYFFLGVYWKLFQGSWRLVMRRWQCMLGASREPRYGIVFSSAFSYTYLVLDYASPLRLLMNVWSVIRHDVVVHLLIWTLFRSLDVRESLYLIHVVLLLSWLWRLQSSSFSYTWVFLLPQTFASKE